MAVKKNKEEVVVEEQLKNAEVTVDTTPEVVEPDTKQIEIEELKEKVSNLDKQILQYRRIIDNLNKDLATEKERYRKLKALPPAQQITKLRKPF